VQSAPAAGESHLIDRDSGRCWCLRAHRQHHTESTAANSTHRMAGFELLFHLIDVGIVFDFVMPQRDLGMQR
jgi:hypothetical protein